MPVRHKVSSTEAEMMLNCSSEVAPGCTAPRRAHPPRPTVLGCRCLFVRDTIVAWSSESGSSELSSEHFGLLSRQGAAISREPALHSTEESEGALLAYEPKQSAS